MNVKNSNESIFVHNGCIQLAETIHTIGRNYHSVTSAGCNISLVLSLKVWTFKQLDKYKLPQQFVGLILVEIFVLKLPRWHRSQTGLTVKSKLYLLPKINSVNIKDVEDWRESELWLLSFWQYYWRWWSGFSLAILSQKPARAAGKMYTMRAAEKMYTTTLKMRSVQRRWKKSSGVNKNRFNLTRYKL